MYAGLLLVVVVFAPQGGHFGLIVLRHTASLFFTFLPTVSLRSFRLVKSKPMPSYTDSPWSRGQIRFCFVAKKTRNETKKQQVPGPGGNDRTRREAFNVPNESSVAALGASLVTKQAGRLPQHD